MIYYFNNRSLCEFSNSQNGWSDDIINGNDRNMFKWIIKFSIVWKTFIKNNMRNTSHFRDDEFWKKKKKEKIDCMKLYSFSVIEMASIWWRH